MKCLKTRLEVSEQASEEISEEVPEMTIEGKIAAEMSAKMELEEDEVIVLENFSSNDELMFTFGSYINGLRYKGYGKNDYILPENLRIYCLSDTF